MLLLLLVACAPPPILELQPAPDVHTVVLASWSTHQAEVGRVRWGELEGEGWTGLAEEEQARTEHELVLAGLHPETAYRFQVEVGGSWLEEEVELETGAIPSRLVDFQVQGEADAFEGFLPVATIGTAPGIVVVDASGEVLWYHLYEDIHSQPRRAWYLPEQRRFLVNAQDRDDELRLLSISLDGAPSRRSRRPSTTTTSWSCPTATCC